MTCLSVSKRFRLKWLFLFLSAILLAGKPGGVCPDAAAAVKIPLNYESLTIKTGSSRTLRPLTMPEGLTRKSFTWKSSNKSVARVSSLGKVTGVKKGKAVITASSKDGKYTASCPVKVRLYPSGISVSPVSMVLGVGEKKNLVATVLPENASSTNVRFRSSDSSTAAVNAEGLVEGRKPGTAVITARTNLGGLEASCKVTVVQEEEGWESTAQGTRYLVNGKPLTGYQEIGAYFYFFDSNGYRKTGIVKSGKTTYYINEKTGRAAQYKTGEKYYNADGTRRSVRLGYHIETYYYAKYYVRKVTDSSMTREEKLFACFLWASDFPYLWPRDFAYQENWVQLYANDFFQGSGGPCQSDASAFAYMAKVLGYKNVFVCLDSADDAENAHCWTEIEGLCYDPLFYRLKGKQYYAFPYSDWGESPEVKVKLS